MYWLVGSKTSIQGTVRYLLILDYGPLEEQNLQKKLFSSW